jgi:hypothetical protein
MKYIITPLSRRFSSAWIPVEEAQEWMRGWRFFFLLALGRSGTAFMADMLDKVPGTHIFHEPVLEDFVAHARAHYNPRAAERYIRGFRTKEIYLRMRNTVPGLYGEANSTLRCHANAIRNAFPTAAILHLVRDGRDVVRSQISRKVMTFADPLSLSIHPMDSDPWRERWQGMDRFSRLCWYWQEENRRLRESTGKTVQFEKLVSSYEYIRDEILDPIGIPLEKALWEKALASPRNITTNFRMPKWENWSLKQKASFTEICGEEMRQCGYVF